MNHSKDSSSSCCTPKTAAPMPHSDHAACASSSPTHKSGMDHKATDKQTAKIPSQSSHASPIAAAPQAAKGDDGLMSQGKRA